MERGKKPPPFAFEPFAMHSQHGKLSIACACCQPLEKSPHPHWSHLGSKPHRVLRDLVKPYRERFESEVLRHFVCAIHVFSSEPKLFRVTSERPSRPVHNPKAAICL